MLLAISLAHAVAVPDTGGGCAPALGASVPQDGDQNVPIDAAIVVQVIDADCWRLGWSLSLYEGWRDRLVQESEQEAPLGYLELVPAAPLEPETTYRLRVADTDGWVASAEYTFTTGTEEWTPSPWTPSISELRAWYDEDNETLDVTVAVDVPLGQPDYTLIRAGRVDGEDDDSPQWEDAAFGFGGATSHLDLFEFSEADPQRVCVAVEGHYLDGSWTEDAVLCADTEPPPGDRESGGATEATACGCSTPSGAPAALAAIASIFAGLSRRIPARGERPTRYTGR